MDPQTIQNRFEQMEKQLSELSNKRKDGWDKFNIAAAVFIPASITFAGYLFSTAIKDAEIASGMQLAARQEVVARVNARVGQAQLVSSFLDALLSSDSKKRKLAIVAVLIGLPEQGPELVKIISETDPDANIQQFATSSLDDRRSKLVKDLFANNKETNSSATKEILDGWLKDHKLIPLILETAMKNKTNEDGVNNTLTIVKFINAPLFLSYQQKIIQFLDGLEPSTPSTKQLVREVRSRF